ncbi:MAG: hypothetical protein HKL90_00570 [Elusimicrobia bacterium]|nr:hypothetical protein [Elusimicrobiota bacterium]
MNAVQLRAFLSTASAVAPAEDYSGPRALVDAVATNAPDAVWRLAACGASPSRLKLSLVGSDAAHPRLDALWDACKASWTAVDSARMDELPAAARALLPAAGPERRRTARAFSAAAFEEPVASALAAFHALEPVAAVLTARRWDGWTLELARPLPWPRFLRCDLAAAFAPRAAALSLLLRDARVVALDFDGEELWARLSG